MPKPSSKFFKREISDLFTDWSLYGLTPAVQTEWQRVWQACLEQDQGRVVPISQVDCLATLGNAIAMKMGSYDKAVAVWTPYFAHPDLKVADERDRNSNMCIRASSRLFAGDMALALTEYRNIIAAAPCRKEQIRLVSFSLSGVRGFCWEQSGTALAEQTLVDFVYEMKAMAMGSPIPRRDFMPLTYRELCYEASKEPPETEVKNKAFEEQ